MSNIEEEEHIVLPIRSEGAKSRQGESSRWHESPRRSEKEMLRLSPKEAVLSSKEGSKLDLSFGEAKEQTKDNIFGMGLDEDPLNTGSPSFKLESFFPEMTVTPKNVPRGRRQPQMHKISAENKKKVNSGSGTARILANSKIAETSGGKDRGPYFESDNLFPREREPPLSGPSSRKFSLSSFRSAGVSERSSGANSRPLEQQRDSISRWTSFVVGDKPKEEVEGPEREPGKKSKGMKVRVFSKLEIGEGAEEHSLSSIRSLE